MAPKLSTIAVFSAVFLLLGMIADANAGPLLVTGPPNGGTLDFGFVLVGTTSFKPLTAINSGTSGSVLQGAFPAAQISFGPTSATPLGPISRGASKSRTYTFSPTTRGNATESIQITGNGGSSKITLKGKGVAPVEQVTKTDAGLTRIGTTANASLTITNVGDGNKSGLGTVSNLNGTVQPITDHHFSGPGLTNFSLTDGAGKTFFYNYAPADHLTNTVTVTVNFANGNSSGNNAPQTVLKTLSGEGVGPLFASFPFPGSLFDFGDVFIGKTASLALDVSNASLDPNGGNTHLTDLSLLKASFIGSDASLFALKNLTLGEVLHEGNTDALTVLFKPHGPLGVKTATLVLSTDQDAAFGSMGDTFAYDLQGRAVAPEPSSLILASAGAVSLLAYRCRRWRRGEPIRPIVFIS